VLGGFHLKRLPHRHLDAAVSALEDAATREVFTGHCTGEKAIAYLSAHSAARVEPLRVGFAQRW
jgi:metal-dependent hydrolase (beta-lactamase superfamily II)